MLLDFEEMSIFDWVQIQDEQVLFDKSSGSEEEKANMRKPPQKPSKIQAGREKPSPKPNKIQEGRNANMASEEKNDLLPQMQAKSRFGRIIKSTPKKQSEKGNFVNVLITQLTLILKED